MKQARWLVVVTLMVVSGLAAAQRIGSSRIVTQVPFEFVAANKIVPAGKCEVQAATLDGNTLLIRNAGAKVSLMASTSQTESKQPASHYALVFKQYGDTYFLSGIKLAGSNIVYHLPESKGEAELRAQNLASTERTLLASLE